MLQVKKICGDSTNSSASGAPADEEETTAASAASAAAEADAVTDLSAALDAPTSGSADVRSLLESLLPTLASARGFYSNLPDSVCSSTDGPFASHDDANCWNGQRYGE